MASIQKRDITNRKYIDHRNIETIYGKLKPFNYLFKL
jgi:hypothetical protein